MKISFIIAAPLVNICVAAENAPLFAIKARAFVRTDIPNEPEDEESLMRGSAPK